MARILIATVPVIGHITPLLPLARALVARGHELRWYTGHKHRAKVEATGARFAGYTRAREIDDAKIDQEFPERARLRGLAQLKFDMKHVFIDPAPDQLADLRELLSDFPADVVVHDTAMLGPLFHRELGGPPDVALGVVPLVMSSRDTAPFGLALPPSSSFFGRIRNRVLNRFVEHVAFRDVQVHWNATRARCGLGPTGWWLDQVDRATHYLQPSVPGFEYPRSELASNVRFVGMMPAEAPKDIPTPPFWSELDGSRPIVHVTQGTIANATPELIAPALEGLAGEDVLVVVSSGNRPIAALGLGSLPSNARISTFLSYPELLPNTAVMVTNGGYGGVQTALSYGVPLVVAGASEDKPEVAARVAWSGAGINLKTAKPTPHAVRDAVRQVLREPRFREAARALAREYSGYDALALTIDLLESIGGGGLGGSPDLGARRLAG